MTLISIGTEFDTDEDKVSTYIIDTMGEDVWNRLREKLGGREIRIPCRVGALHDAHALVLALGREDATTLVQTVPGERVYVRRLPPPDHKQPYLIAMREGLSNQEIAIRLGVSVRHARRMLMEAGVSNPNVSPLPARATSADRVLDDEFQRRAKIYLRYKNGEFETKAMAATRLGMQAAAFVSFVRNYRSELDEYVAAHMTASRAVSNATLTGRAPVSLVSARHAPETRVSGP